jgi:hypothetical protein
MVRNISGGRESQDKFGMLIAEGGMIIRDSGLGVREMRNGDFGMRNAVRQALGQS